MCAGLVVVFLIRLEQMMQVPLAKHNDMVKAIPPDRPDEPLRASVLPWRPHCNRPIANTHRLQPSEDDVAIDAITVANDVARRPLPSVCLGRIRCDIDPDQTSATQTDDDEGIEQLEANGQNNEQIHGRDARSMIAQEGGPSLRGRPCPL